jgi:hypothetical protein
MRVENLPGLVRRPAHRAAHVIGVHARAGEERGDILALRIGQPHRARTLKALHLRGQRGAVAAIGVEQQPLEIRADLDVHRRGGGRLDLPLGIVARR